MEKQRWDLVEGERFVSRFSVWWLAAYAIAMALLEAVVVVYMRQLYYPDNPLDLFPLRFLDQYNPAVELGREVATVLMIIAVAMLAEHRSWSHRFAAFVFVFGLWDLFYYGWLKALMGWPRTWLEWDVLFLVPVIWLGPWICPAAIATLFAAWGGWALRSESRVKFDAWSFGVFVVGAMLGLVSFFQPALAHRWAHGADALRDYRPGVFWWASYIAGLAGMSWGLIWASKPLEDRSRDRAESRSENESFTEN